MVRGLYTAYTGMMQQEARMEVLTNNLANSTTVGFKKEGSTAQSFNEMLTIKVKDATTAYMDQGIGKMSLGVKVGENYTDYSQGSFKATGNTFDVALSGDGFFNISYTSKSGVTETMYTRAGEFTLTQDGYLVTKDGDYVLGQGGEIVLPTEATISIDATGAIYADDEYIDTFQITDFEDYNYIAKFGENLYRVVDNATEKEVDNLKFVQGYLEMSNVNIVSEMVELIDITRAYESNQKLIQAMDSTLEKSVNLGRLS